MNMNPITRFAAVTLAAITLLLAGVLMDGPSDTRAAQDVADEAEYAAALADGGAAKCAKLGRVPRWLPEGDLVCRAAEPLVAQGGRP